VPNYLFLKPCRAEISENVEILLRAVVNKVDGPLNQSRQRLIRRMTRRAVKTSQGIITTSILNLRTAGMSLSTFESWSKNRWRLRKMYVPPIRLMMRKNVPAIRKAGRTDGLISASLNFGCYSLPHLFLQLLRRDILKNLRFPSGMRA
jgi:hypothetical protein